MPSHRWPTPRPLPARQGRSGRAMAASAAPNVVPRAATSRRERALKALAVLLAASALAGCASPDYPTPRRPIIPQPVQDLEARQQGDAVVLTFTLPSQSTRRE